MGAMPDHLRPSANHTEAQAGDRLGGYKTAKHGFRMAIDRQKERIAYLRSAGYEWGEAVFHLRDMLHGLEDEEFWDGIPDKVRARLEAIQDPEEKEEAYEMARERFAEYGWERLPMRAVQARDGRVVFKPTAEDLSRALRVVNRLVVRLGLVIEEKRRTRFAPFGQDLEDTNGQGEP